MANSPNKLSQFWQEFRRRKVLPFIIGYIAACFAIIEFFLNTSVRYNISDKTLDVIYILAAAGLPIVLILPWFLNRPKDQDNKDDPVPILKESKEEKKPKHNLPAQLTSFIGRKNEMQVVKDLIREYRLVTLTGTGGCGKTRLACELAASILSEFKDGVWFVDLAPVSMEDLIIKEIIETLSIKEAPNQTLIVTLLEKIKDQHALIILDNCEHLIKACAEIAGRVITAAPQIKILATSREALNIMGEKIWRVPSLTLLDPKAVIDIESARRSEAVMLFADRARLSNPEFNLASDNVDQVATICYKLDGIPLALELVASRTRHMDPKTILEKFGDRFEEISTIDPGISKRQQTLQSTIEWSYNLLSEQEKTLLTRLVVFNGSFDLNAVEAICTDERLPEADIIDVLSRLVDRSLIHTIRNADHPLRYGMLETLKQYAQKEIIIQKEEIAFRMRHLQYYTKIAEQAYTEQFESQLYWLNALETEHDNIISALNWSYVQYREYFIKLSSYLGWFWFLHSHYNIGNEYLEKALEIDAEKTADYSRSRFALANLLFWRGDQDRYTRLMHESLAFWRQENNLLEEAIVLSWIGSNIYSGDPEEGAKYSEESLRIARKIGVPGLVNHCLTQLCQCYVFLKQFDKAKPYTEELLISSEKLDQPWGIIGAHHFGSDCALGTGDFKDSERKYATTIKIKLKYSFDAHACYDLQGVAFSVAGQSRWAKAIRLDSAAREIAGKYGSIIDGVAAFWDEWIDRYIEGAKKEVGEELAKQYKEEGIAMGFEKAVEYALDFEKD